MKRVSLIIQDVPAKIAIRIQDEAVQRILAGSSRAGTNIYRAQSRFTTSLGLGEFLGLALPFILHLLFTRSSLLIRALCVLSLPLLVYVVRVRSPHVAIGTSSIAVARSRPSASRAAMAEASVQPAPWKVSGRRGHA
mgnify:CR=1 FL=1